MPVVTTIAEVRPRTSPLNFAINMALRTPWVRVTTEVETTSAREAPVATRAAAWIVEPASDGGMRMARASGARAALRATDDGASPRRVRRCRKRSLARASRLESVPSGMPSRRAAAWRDRPSSSQRTTAPRYEAGQPGQFLVEDRPELVEVRPHRPAGNRRGDMACAFRSRAWRRRVRARASRAVRLATP